jgi:Flp pilus assembly pilin Flp
LGGYRLRAVGFHRKKPTATIPHIAERAFGLLRWGVPGEGGSMLHDRNGQSVVEYIVILAILITLVGGALWEIFSTLRVKFNDVNAEIGS